MQYSENENKHNNINAYTDNVDERTRRVNHLQGKAQAVGEIIKGGVEVMDDISTATGFALGGIEGTIGVGRQVAKQIFSGGVNAAKGGGFLRGAYVSEVEGLSSVASKMRGAGSSSEEIARTLHGLRRGLGVKYKSLTPDNVLQQIYQRNLQKYGDKLGPRIDYLRQQGKSWDDIINSATRTGGKDLGF